MRILVVEDEKNIAKLLVNGLRAERLAVDWAGTAAKGLLWAKVNDYDAAVVDIRLGQHGNGLEICKAARAKGKTFPIIILSAISGLATKIEALNLGADDYLTKPFSVGELVARLRALMRREKRVIEDRLELGDLELDAVLHTVRRSGKPIRLNKKEFSLLEYFMRNPGVTLTRSMILEHVWDMNADPFTNTVDVHIRFLRSKIDDDFDEKLIKTVHGHGYKIETE